MDILEFILLGILVGALTGITGSSGVVAVVPALSIINRYDVATAIGTSLFIDIVTSSIVFIVYLKNKNVNTSIMLPFAIGSIIGSQAGVRIAVSIPSFILKDVFGSFLLLMGVYSVLRRKKNVTSKNSILGGKCKFLLAFSISIIISLATGLMGASGGIMYLIAMLFIFKEDVRVAVGTATALMIISASSGATGYFFYGRIDLIAGIVIGVTSLISGYFFAKLGNKIKRETVNKVLIVMFFTIGIIQIAY
ncbi:hypothetical protein [Thermoplasma volcanium GSS1]|uniref:Probable membrane transporter protein n=1 Tax=Thermoplasma volcanium (strain ATCC 51530 / DSM 4299 / JCM 9571 / NBRC 15438 / GSS1) TaxID=273116 RepID=Q97A14_THEVO|nr:sulfite exporter TauE/SafE family protein [Thermoplasma volcanium]BAB60138.1 hypothetical protein [Thermoplasma volcanium GSS1]